MARRPRLTGSLPRRTKAARDTVRAFRWTRRELVPLRHELDLRGLDARPGQAPALAGRARIGVEWALRSRRATCLERALILQSWYLARGIHRTIVVGVGLGDHDFAAHAWLEGEDDGGHRELTRLEPREPTESVDD
jgi:hypothetical protein